MTRTQFQAMPLNYEGRRVGWAVFPAGDLRMAVGYAGRLAWWRARFRALRMNLKGR